MESVFHNCPRCETPVAVGANECTSCGQELCPECGAAVSENTTACPECGLEWELLCANCDAVIGPHDTQCPHCGLPFQPPHEAGSGETSAAGRIVSEPESATARDISAFRDHPLFAPGTLEPLACSVCGRQDETLRAVSYPYTVGVVFFTLQRRFSGVWCQKHRNLYWVLASLITATLGWLGVPSGLVFTPLALFRLALGGDQPPALNRQLLKDLAERELRRGDAPAAIRCLEAALQFGYDETLRERLRQLYQRHWLTTPDPDRAPIAPIVGGILGAAVIGAMAGVLDYASVAALSPLYGGKVWLMDAVLSWIPLVAVAFLAGLVLRQLTLWALTRARISQKALGVSVAALMAFLALYGLPQGRAIGQYVGTLRSGTEFRSTGEAILTSGAVLTRGGVFTVMDALAFWGSSGVIYLAILLACAIYYGMIGFVAAVRITWWQRQLSSLRDGGVPPAARASRRGWIAVSLTVLGMATLAVLSRGHWMVRTQAVAIAHNESGVELLQQGELEEAVAEFEAAIRLLPDYAIGHSNLGWAYHNMGEMYQAAEIFVEATELDPGLVYAHQGLGWSCYWTGQTGMAERAFETALQLQPDDGSSLNGLGLVRLGQGQLGDAELYLTKALDLAPDNYLTHWGLGWLYSEKGDLDRAVPHYQEAVKRNPQFWSARFGLSRMHMARAEFDEAIVQLEELVAAQPDAAPPHAMLALIYFATDQPLEMEREIGLMESAAFQDADAHYARAIVYATLEQYSRAEEHLLKSAELLSDKAYIYRDLAGVYAAQQEYDRAFEACDRALELDQDDAKAYARRADVFVEHEDLDQALEELSHALDIAPEDGNLHSALSFVHFYKGHTTQALMEAKNAVRLNRYGANGHANLAFAYYAMGELDRALEAAREAVRLAPKYDRAHYILGLCYRDTGEDEKAIAAFESFLDLYRDRAYVRDDKVQAETHLAQLR